MAKGDASEDKIHERLRELADATRRVRKDLEELIRNKPYREYSRGIAHDESRAHDRTHRKPDE